MKSAIPRAENNNEILSFPYYTPLKKVPEFFINRYTERVASSFIISRVFPRHLNSF